MKRDNKYKLLCIAPEGEYIIDSIDKDIEVLKDNSCNMGSKWIFYPYHVIIKGNTIFL